MEITINSVSLKSVNGKLRVLLDVDGLDDRDVLKLNGTADHRCFDLQRLCKTVGIEVSKTADEETAANLFAALPVTVELEIGRTENKTFDLTTKQWVLDEVQFETYSWSKVIDLG